MKRIFLEHKDLKPMWRFTNGLETREQMEANKDLLSHGEKVFRTVDAAVNGLDNIEALVPVLVKLGEYHQPKGVKDPHFSVDRYF